MRRRLTLLVVALGAFAPAACGESAEDKYKQDFPPRQAWSCADSAARSSASGSCEHICGRFVTTPGSWATFNYIDALEPPDDLAETMTRLGDRDVKAP